MSGDGEHRCVGPFESSDGEHVRVFERDGTYVGVSTQGERRIELREATGGAEQAFVTRSAGDDTTFVRADGGDGGYFSRTQAIPRLVQKLTGLDRLR